MPGFVVEHAASLAADRQADFARDASFVTGYEVQETELRRVMRDGTGWLTTRRSTRSGTRKAATRISCQVGKKENERVPGTIHHAPVGNVATQSTRATRQTERKPKIGNSASL